MSDSPGAAIQEKVKRSVGKGWCIKPSPPRLSLCLSCIRRLRIPSASPHDIFFKGPICKNTTSLYLHLISLDCCPSSCSFMVATNAKMLDLKDGEYKISQDCVSGGPGHQQKISLWLSQRVKMRGKETEG